MLSIYYLLIADMFYVVGMTGKFGGMRMDGEGAAHKKRSLLWKLFQLLLTCFDNFKDIHHKAAVE